MKRKRIVPAGTFDSMTYRGYVIQLNMFNGVFYISRGGHHISSAKTLDEAKRMIDEVLVP